MASFKHHVSIFVLTVTACLFCLVKTQGLQEEDVSVFQQHCPNYRRCSTSSANASTVVANSTVTSCCLPCSCDSNLCRPSNNCCPDIESSSNTNANISEQVCVPTSKGMTKYLHTNSLYQESLSQIRLGVTMVKDCPHLKTDSRCVTPNITKLVENVPVFSAVSGVTYFNKFCAECNNETTSDLTPWRAFISCSDITVMKSDDLLFPSTVRGIYTFAMGNGKEDCGFDFLPPENFTTTPNLCFMNAAVISSCPSNYTDSKIIRFCNDINLPYLRANLNESVVYKNYFCYVCNINIGINDYQCPANLDLVLPANNDYIVEANVNGEKESKFLLPWIRSGLTPSRVTPVGVNCGRMATFDPFQVCMIISYLP